MSTIYDPRYIRLIEHLQKVRKDAGITQSDLAKKLRLDQSAVSKVEGLERRIDIIELHDWVSAIGYDHKMFLQEAGWMREAVNTSLPAVPFPGGASDVIVGGRSGTSIEMAWQGEKRGVFIAGLTASEYLKLEVDISKIYKALNAKDTKLKNREAILSALELAIHAYPDVNPSDLYHHVVYRLYLRGYTKTQADRSWVRAGGEAFELFFEGHYNALLKSHGIELRWLCNDGLRSAALKEMDIQEKVGGSKLDLALYGHKGKRLIAFGGIHAKASLAERVSDDVPCSVAMMQNGLVSFLVTLDAKSFPPPSGVLVNRGELGSPANPSDKRNYVEQHGSFTGCFSYNLRSAPSPLKTPSKRRIQVSTFNPASDPLPREIIAAWRAFSVRRT